MKGISPIIATIILIALTIAIAGILGLWAASYVAHQTSEINQTQEYAAINCQLMKFRTISCIKENANTIRMIISNEGNIDIKGLIINFFEIENNIIKNINSTQENKIIKRGMYEILRVPIVLNNYNRITIRSVQCPEIEIEVSCS